MDREISKCRALLGDRNLLNGKLHAKLYDESFDIIEHRFNFRGDYLIKLLGFRSFVRNGVRNSSLMNAV